MIGYLPNAYLTYNKTLNKASNTLTLLISMMMLIMLVIFPVKDMCALQKQEVTEADDAQAVASLALIPQ